MRAVICHETSGPDALVIEEVPSPACAPDRVRVSIGASGLNYVDALFVEGRYQIRPPVPFVPGSEIAGEISEVGSSVKGWSVGDRVFASIGLGGFADEAVVHPDQLLRIPPGLDHRRAATMTQSYATAWYCLTKSVTVTPDEQVVVLGAAGGVGLAVIDVARSLGANVTACASSDSKLRLCTERGANGVIDYSNEDLKSRIRDLTGGGADIVVDPVGGPHTEAALRALGERGRLLIVGFASGEIPSLPANQILLRNRLVVGVDWGAWAMANPFENRSMIEQITAEVERGALDPVAPVTYRLQDVSTALNDLLNRRITGKACLV